MRKKRRSREKINEKSTHHEKEAETETETETEGRGGANKKTNGTLGDFL